MTKTVTENANYLTLFSWNDTMNLQVEISLLILPQIYTRLT